MLGKRFGAREDVGLVRLRMDPRRGRRPGAGHVMFLSSSCIIMPLYNVLFMQL